MSTPKIKYKNLNAADRDTIRDAFQSPLHDAASERADANRLEVGNAIIQKIFTKDQRNAIDVLRKAGWLTVQSEAYLCVAGVTGYTPIRFTDQALPNPYYKYEVSQEDYDLAKQPNLVRDAEMKGINDLTRELNAVLLTCKTRKKLGEVWPAVYDLMGADFRACANFGPLY